MEKDEPERELPVIVCRKAKRRCYLRSGEKKFGPWDELDRQIRYSPDKKHWAIRGKLHGQYYVLADGVRCGPFDGYVEGPEFDEERGVFVFAAMRGNEFLLVAGKKVMRWGKIVEKAGDGKYVRVGKNRFGPYHEVWFSKFSTQGNRWAVIAGKEEKGFYLLLDGREFGPFSELTPRGEFSPNGRLFFCRELFNENSRTMVNIIINGERVYSPCEETWVHFFSPDGKRWAIHAKRGEFEGLVVDGKEFGNYPFPNFIFNFSPDSRRWYALIGRGEKDMVVIDGREFGTYKLKAPGFSEDSRFEAFFSRGGARWVIFDGREIGPYRCLRKKAIVIGDAFLNDLVFVKNGERKVRRCVISIAKEGGSGRIYFGPKTGETLKDAIEIINAADTDEGVAAEHKYVRLICQSEGRTYKLLEQQHIPCKEKNYDRLLVRFDNGEERNFYFDITSFYGRFTPQLKLLKNKKPDETGSA